MSNLVPFDSRLFDGRVARCNATKDCDETAQNLRRRRDGSEIRVSCGSWEVTCPGYEPWPGGSNGTKAERLYHNNMPKDEYLQAQMVNKIQESLANFNSQPQPASALVNGGGKCLDVHAPDIHKNGAKVQVWDCNGAPQQQWTFSR